MATTTIRVAVLTISDNASTNPSYDKSLPCIQTILQSIQGFECILHRVCPDDKDLIQINVVEICRGGDIDLLITTGGTGFGQRDVTPEAVSPLLERPAPGIVHLLLSASLACTPFAALSRPVAGTIKKTLVVTLPGSVKAVKENLGALLRGGILQHAVDLNRGGSGASTHAALAAGTQPHECHHYTHVHATPTSRDGVLSHDPSKPVSARHRASPYPILSFDGAMHLVLTKIEPLPTEKRPVTPALAGYVLAEDVRAPQDIPHTHTTSVDGYAVRSTDPPGIYPVLIARTHVITDPLPHSKVYRINTGQALPLGSDAVTMVEDTRLVTVSEQDGEEVEIETLVQVPCGENVRKPGSDVRKGDLVASSGELISARGGEIGTLVFVGRKEVEVYRKPVIAILSTGEEIHDVHATEGTLGVGLWDTNRPLLTTALQGMGYEVQDLGIVPDKIEEHMSALLKGIQMAHIVVTTGGTSMGPTDLLKPIIERHLDGTIHFGRVSLKPGKPTTFATIREGGRDVPLFALPGNPASALVMLYVFVVPALRRLGGWAVEKCQLPRVQVEVQDHMPLDPRTEFHRVRIQSGPEGLVAHSTGSQRSSRAPSLCGANGLVIIPPKVPGGKELIAKGEKAEALLIGEVESCSKNL